MPVTWEWLLINSIKNFHKKINRIIRRRNFFLCQKLKRKSLLLFHRNCIKLIEEHQDDSNLVILDIRPHNEFEMNISTGRLIWIMKATSSVKKWKSMIKRNIILFIVEVV